MRPFDLPRSSFPHFEHRASFTDVSEPHRGQVFISSLSSILHKPDSRRNRAPALLDSTAHFHPHLFSTHVFNRRARYYRPASAFSFQPFIPMILFPDSSFT